MINIKDIKPGDVVTIYATARVPDSFGGFTVSISPHGHHEPMRVTVDPKEIATHEPAPMKLGDKVRLIIMEGRAAADVWTVHGLFKDRAWLVSDHDESDLSIALDELVPA